MWLIELHFSISVLCALTCIGVKKLFKENIVKNGWLTDQKAKKSALGYSMFFVPVINVFIILVLFIMVFFEKEEFENLVNNER